MRGIGTFRAHAAAARISLSVARLALGPASVGASACRRAPWSVARRGPAVRSRSSPDPGSRGRATAGSHDSKPTILTRCWANAYTVARYTPRYNRQRLSDRITTSDTVHDGAARGDASYDLPSACMTHQPSRDHNQGPPESTHPTRVSPRHDVAAEPRSRTRASREGRRRTLHTPH